jgi:hypothetical protein
MKACETRHVNVETGLEAGPIKSGPIFGRTNQRQCEWDTGERSTGIGQQKIDSQEWSAGNNGMGTSERK